MPKRLNFELLQACQKRKLPIQVITIYFIIPTNTNNKIVAEQMYFLTK